MSSRVRSIVISSFAAFTMGCAAQDTIAPDPGPTQSEADEWTAAWILGAVRDIYNQNVAGRSGGYRTLTADCPNGGTVSVAGSASSDQSSGLTTVDLTYDLQACKVIKSYGTLEATGRVSETGSFRTGFRSISYQSSGALALTGTLTLANRAPGAVDFNCAFTANDTSEGVAGSLCGRSFSY